MFPPQGDYGITLLDEGSSLCANLASGILCVGTKLELTTTKIVIQPRTAVEFIFLSTVNSGSWVLSSVKLAGQGALVLAVDTDEDAIVATTKDIPTTDTVVLITSAAAVEVVSL